MKLKLITENLNIGDKLEVKGMDTCGNVLIGKYLASSDPSIAPLTGPTDNACTQDINCPLVQPLINNVTRLPGFPECCPNGLIGRDNACGLRTICPDNIKSYIGFDDKYVIADPTDPTPGTLIDKLVSCKPDLLKISLDTSGGNHKVNLCLNIKEAELKITDLVDGPKSYPNCSPSSTGVLIGKSGHWSWLCPQPQEDDPCTYNQSAHSKDQFLKYNATTQSVVFQQKKPFYHASVWNNHDVNVIYAGSPDLPITTIPCNARGQDAGGNTFMQCMYKVGTCAYSGLPTWDIYIPETGYWYVSFRARSLCNTHTHAHRMGVLVVGNGAESGWKVLADVKSGAFDDEYQPEPDGDSSFIYSGIFDCSLPAHQTPTSLNHSELSGGWGDEFWLEKGTRLRMFIKADAKKCGRNQQQAPAKVKILGHNQWSQNHPKATVAGFSVYKLPIDIL